MEKIAMQIEEEQRVKFYVHVLGPDDLYPFASEFDALIEANGINKIYLEQRLKLGPDAPLCVAVVKKKEEIDSDA